MSIFELYSANVPLLVPDAALLRQLGSLCSLAHYGGGAVGYGQRRGGGRRWSALSEASSTDFFIERADYYDSQPDGMPHIHTFASVDELGTAIASIDTRATSAAMAQANRSRASRVRSAWRCLMQSAFPQLADSPAAS